jgi:death-on-curing protein
VTDEIDWIPEDLVVVLHAELLRQFGGASGLLNNDGLFSALARPKQPRHYRPATTLFQLSAAYAYGLTENHPFADGNKRIAFAVAASFLEVHGYLVDTTQRDVHETVVALSEKKIDEARFAAWLERIAVRRSDLDLGETQPRGE